MLTTEQVLILVRLAKTDMPNPARLKEITWEGHLTSQSSTVALLQAMEGALRGYTDEDEATRAARLKLRGLLEESGAPRVGAKPTLVDQAIRAHELWTEAVAAVSALRETLNRIETKLDPNLYPGGGGICTDR